MFICSAEMHAGQGGQDDSTLLVLLWSIHVMLCGIVHIPDYWGLRGDKNVRSEYHGDEVSTEKSLSVHSILK